MTLSTRPLRMVCLHCQPLARCMKCVEGRFSMEWLMTFMVLLLTISALRCPTWRPSVYVPVSDMEEEVWACPVSEPSTLPLCPLVPNGLPRYVGVKRRVNQTLLEHIASEVEPGGRWRPKHCRAQQSLVVLVPYRDRAMHLALFLQHMHPFLQSQLLDYSIYIVEQSAEHDFNRAKLFNIGFVEALKDRGDACCFVFHDVDLLPENGDNLYACGHQPRHMCAALDTFRYVLPYPELFGGVVAMHRQHFEALGGFSNRFFGWGGEDDDLAARVKRVGLNIVRWEPKLTMYSALSHVPAAPNPARYNLLQERDLDDGLSSLSYRLLKHERRPLYTNLLVDVGNTETRMHL
ncbi:beta-1,4-N-acetylgalactosaminyltransferase bre-4-like [Ornithodoros turicata]|uniref:beta-1,4-N-acetylgalactosaminyltransferase bre-4-like n=1 Tax=Ornithodoros turicata TaxID=34597 RepID=UPI003138C90A